MNIILDENAIMPSKAHEATYIQEKKRRFLQEVQHYLILVCIYNCQNVQ